MTCEKLYPMALLCYDGVEAQLSAHGVEWSEVSWAFYFFNLSLFGPRLLFLSLYLFLFLCFTRIAAVTNMIRLLAIYLVACIVLFAVSTALPVPDPADATAQPNLQEKASALLCLFSCNCTCGSRPSLSKEHRINYHSLSMLFERMT